MFGGNVLVSRIYFVGDITESLAKLPVTDNGKYNEQCVPVVSKADENIQK